MITLSAMTDDISTTSLQGSQGLQQFLLLAKTARGPAAVELVKQALSASGVYVFGELLETECVKDLSSESNNGYVTLLEIFAYGTYSDYKGECPLLYTHESAPSHTLSSHTHTHTHTTHTIFKYPQHTIFTHHTHQH